MTTTHLFTPTFIRMAKVAEELQSKVFLEVGDWFLIGEKLAVVQQSAGGPGGELRKEPGWVWLPRLDQLTDMLLVAGGPDLVLEEGDDPHESSLKQLMTLFYGKTWTGKEWV